MKVLVTGRNGQVGQALNKVLDKNFTIFTDRSQFDMAADDLEQKLRQINPDLIINAAAYTLVDQAESDQAMAYQINGHAPKLMAQYCAQHQIPLIHFSTDYVFNGYNDHPWLEEEPIEPINAYGKSKAMGENGIRDSGCPHLILRTSWVYGQEGKNFLLTMKRLLTTQPEVKVINDQTGSPTWAVSLAQATALILEKIVQGHHQWGTYHLTNAGMTTWFGFAKAIASHLADQGILKAQLMAISTHEYPTTAARPSFSVLSNEKILKVWGIQMPTWETALSDCMKSKTDGFI